jgi:glutamate---cysteine ligase / carboxylate-amine ligase
LPDPDARIDVMRRMLPYVPLLLALSTSSPFWQSRRTGLMGYRLAGHDEQPRSGLPDLFRTTAEFDAYVTALVRSGVIADSSFLWWAIRPSLRHPTLELRAPDCCTLVEDSIAIAALYRTIVRHLFVEPGRNAAIGAVGRAIALENKWRAQRYGVKGTFIADTFIADEGAVPVADCLKRVIAETARDAEALGCTDDVGRCVAIAAEGTSADAQVAIFEAHKEGTSHEDALRAVLDWIAAATLQ